MLIPSMSMEMPIEISSLSRRVNANSQHDSLSEPITLKLIKKGEC